MSYIRNESHTAVYLKLYAGRSLFFYVFGCFGIVENSAKGDSNAFAFNQLTIYTYVFDEELSDT